MSSVTNLPHIEKIHIAKMQIGSIKLRVLAY